MFSHFYHKYPFFVLLLPLVAGILWVHHQGVVSTEIVLGGMGMAGILLLIGTRKKARDTIFLVGIFSLLFWISVYRSSPRSLFFEEGRTYLLRGECMEVVHPRVCWIRCGQHKIYLQSWDSLPTCAAGDSLQFRAKLFHLSPRANLFEFDFNHYLAIQGLQAKALPCSPLIRTGHSSSLYSRCQQIRTLLLEKTTRVIPDSLTRSLVQSLCLGYRQEIDSKTKNLFQLTGTIHLLAISGLHMGAIYLLLSHVLRLFHINPKRHKWIVIPFLWLFAAISGLSPSVCRAASILTFIALGELLNRNHLPLHAIAVSAFFTLLINPNLLFSVSFQMSYAAYTGIILLCPLLLPLGPKKHKLWKETYALLCVSFSAQIATLPLTAYYFHYINLNSLLVNLVAVPLGMFLLYAGILTLLLPIAIGKLFLFIPLGLAHLLLWVLHIFSLVAFLQQGLYPSLLQLFLLYGFVCCLICYWSTRKRSFIPIASLLLFSLLVCTGVDTYRKHHLREVIIYNRHGKSSILFAYDGYYTFLKNTTPHPTPPPYTRANNLQPFRQTAGFLHSDIQFYNNRLTTQTHTIYIADLRHKTPYNANILIVTENLSPEQLPSLATQSPQRIILDASHKYHSRHLWEQWCQTHGIPLQQTTETGSILLPLP